MSGRELPRGIGRYRPIEILGAGGMGTVYKAHDPVIDRMVAVKVVHTDALDPATRAEYLERFRLEAQAAGGCMHEAIVIVYDYANESGDPYIVMEWVDGRSLQQMLHDPTSRASLPVVPILTQVLGGLACAHRLGITHRDIKPANIIVTASGEAKIADFGIARLSRASLDDSSLTQVGSLLGTPNYMAPEQVRGDAVDHRTDLFAVGAILYQALTGRPPFAGRNMSETIQRLTDPEPASMVAVEAAGRSAYVPLLQRALAKRREQRFQSAGEFAASLRAVGMYPSSPIPAYDDPQATAPPGSTPSMLTAGGGRWDPGTLQRIERALARYVGPMARVIVSQAARQSGTAAELHEAVARALPISADRSAFLRTLGSVRVEPTLGSASPGAVPSRPDPTLAISASGDARPIPPDAAAAAQTALAFFVGPIARMLVRQAVADASSPQDFMERLCAHVTHPDEIVALRRRLRAEVEPRLR
jgi:serine/threonine-protein kinase